MNLHGTPVHKATGGRGYRTKRARLRALKRQREHLFRSAPVVRKEREER